MYNKYDSTSTNPSCERVFACALEGAIGRFNSRGGIGTEIFFGCTVYFDDRESARAWDNAQMNFYYNVLCRNPNFGRYMSKFSSQCNYETNFVQFSHGIRKEGVELLREFLNQASPQLSVKTEEVACSTKKIDQLLAPLSLTSLDEKMGTKALVSLFKVNPKTCSQKDIDKGYRTLCLMYHPDKHPEATSEQLEAISEEFKKLEPLKNRLIREYPGKLVKEPASRWTWFGGSDSSNSKEEKSERPHPSFN